MHTGDVPNGTLRSIWRQSGLLDELAGVNSVREAMARLEAGNPGPLPLTPDQRTVSGIADDARTQSFWTDNNGRVAYMYSEEQKAVLAITSDRRGEVVQATMRRFETAGEAANFFGEMRSRAARTTGVMPQIIDDGIRGLRAAFQGTHGGRIPPALRNAGEDVGRFLGQASRVLGVVGIAAATAEVTHLAMNARDLSNFGNLRAEAITEYDALLAAHITQSVADPTIVGGELATQSWFSGWADRWGLEEHERAELQPSSLLRDLQEGLEMARTAVRAVAMQALQSAGHAAVDITQAMLREKMRDIVRDVMNSGPDGLRRFVERNGDALGRQLSPADIGRFNNHFEGLSLRPPSQRGIFPGFNFPEIRIPIPEINIPNIIPEIRLPRIPNIIPGLLGEGNSPSDQPETRLAQFNDPADPDKSALQTAMYNALPDNPAAISALPESLQTMAVVKNDPSLFASELNLFIDENGTESAQRFIDFRNAQEAVRTTPGQSSTENIAVSLASRSDLTSMRL